MKPMKRVNCHKCKSYFVTWDNKLPHGCRALGFRSKEFPSMVVYKNSGIPCRYFEGKKSSGESSTKKKGLGKWYA